MPANGRGVGTSSDSTAGERLLPRVAVVRSAEAAGLGRGQYPSTDALLVRRADQPFVEKFLQDLQLAKPTLWDGLAAGRHGRCRPRCA